MSLHYLLDGYNIIQQSPTLSRKKLEDGRQGLIAFLRVNRPQGSVNNRVTVVFDGQADVFGGATSGRDAQIQVIFSVGETADDKINRIVTAAQEKNSVIVVSDDRALTQYARALGARSMKVKDFLAQAKTSTLGRGRTSAEKSTKAKNPDAAPKMIPYALEFEITDELKKRWLK